MTSSGESPFDIVEGQDAVDLNGEGAQDSSRVADQYLDDGFVSHITTFDPEIELNSGEFEKSAMKSLGNGDSQVAGDLLSLNPFGEAGSFTSSGLDDSLLNRHLEGNSDYSLASKFLQTGYGQNNETLFLNDHYCVVPSASNLSINTLVSSRPQHSRKLSHLRNEYFPSTEAEAPMAGLHPQQVYTSSPSRYTLRPQQGLQPGPGSSQILQPFQESNLRSSIPQLPGYTSINQMTQYQQPTYPDPETYAQHPISPSSLVGHSYQPIKQHTVATPWPREFAMRPPSTPPNLHASLVGSSESNVSYADSSSDNIKHESSSAGSPFIPVKRVIRKVRTRVVTKSLDVDNVQYSKSDSDYIGDLMDAMTDMSQAEDNVGMKKTWKKILVQKADKIRPMCVEVLGLIKRAVNEQLGDKTSANSYRDFEHRFQEFCDAARTQKTIGKHLMEAPYSHTVANDPTYAASRVRNNRRVNGQKRTAITLGRRAMGLAKGRGKGHRLRKLDGSSVKAVEDSLGDLLEDAAEDSGVSEDDDVFAMDDELNSPVVKSEPPSVRRSARNSTKKTYADEVDDSPVAKKKKKTRSRLVYQNTDEDEPVDGSQRTQFDFMDRDTSNNRMINMPRSVDRAYNSHVTSRPLSYLPAMRSSPAQRLEQPQFHQNSHIFGYHPYDPTATSPASLQIDHSGGLYSQHGLLFDHPSQQYTGYSPSFDQEFMEHAHSEKDPDGIKQGATHQMFHPSEAH